MAWLVFLVLFAVIEVALNLFGLPSPALIGGLLAGLLYAVTAPVTLELPAAGIKVAPAVLGTAIGALVSVETIKQLAHEWLPIIVVSLATLALSVGAGMVLRLHRDVSPATGTFAMVAGGASGIVAIARSLGADDRIVAVVQYLRVLLILVGMPVVTQLVFRPEPVHAAGISIARQDGPIRFTLPNGLVVRLDGAGDLRGVVLLVICVTLGLLMTRWIRIPAGSLLLPLLICVALVLTGWMEGVGVAQLAQNAAFAVIGVQVGLRFTRESLRSVATLLPLALATILGLIVVCALFGVILGWATGRSGLEGYLATTPGGLYAVLATAIGSGSDVTFVLTVQIVRLLVVLFSAPLLAAWLRRHFPSVPGSPDGPDSPNLSDGPRT